MLTWSLNARNSKLTYPQFSNLNVACWQHPKKLGFAVPTVCLHRENTDAGRPLLNALEELSMESPPAQRILTFKPTQKKKGISKLRLQFVLPSDELRVINIACTPGTADIVMTAKGLEVLREAILTWLNGGEDFGIHARNSDLKQRELGALDKSSGELWFWGPTMTLNAG